MTRAKDLAGLRVGRLVALECAESGRPGAHAKWLCRCDCGGTAVVRSSNLTSGQTKSCGCLARERGHYLGSQQVSRRGQQTIVERLNNFDEFMESW